MAERRPLRLALTKGRLEEKTVLKLESSGIDCSSIRSKGRRLVLPVNGPDMEIELVLAKAADVITYVEHGVCDIGVVGKDTILENAGAFFEVADLGFGRCRFCLAAKSIGNLDTATLKEQFYSGYSCKTIATKYPNVTRNFFQNKGMDVDIVKIEGSVELAPILGLADAIVDIVETGSTLAENGLALIEEIAPISARLIVNPVSMKLKQEYMESLIKMLDS